MTWMHSFNRLNSVPPFVYFFVFARGDVALLPLDGLCPLFYGPRALVTGGWAACPSHQRSRLWRRQVPKGFPCFFQGH